MSCYDVNQKQDVAQKADVNNAAWEIVCNASASHETNVRRIEV